MVDSVRPNRQTVGFHCYPSPTTHQDNYLAYSSGPLETKALGFIIRLTLRKTSWLKHVRSWLYTRFLYRTCIFNSHNFQCSHTPGVVDLFSIRHHIFSQLTAAGVWVNRFKIAQLHVPLLIYNDICLTVNGRHTKRMYHLNYPKKPVLTSISWVIDWLLGLTNIYA